MLLLRLLGAVFSDQPQLDSEPSLQRLDSVLLLHRPVTQAYSEPSLLGLDCSEQPLRLLELLVSSIIYKSLGPKYLCLCRDS